MNEDLQRANVKTEEDGRLEFLTSALVQKPKGIRPEGIKCVFYLSYDMNFKLKEANMPVYYSDTMTTSDGHQSAISNLELGNGAVGCGN